MKQKRSLKKQTRRRTKRQQGGSDFSKQMQVFVEEGEIDTLSHAATAVAKVKDSSGAFLGTAFFYCEHPYLLTACHVVNDTAQNQPKHGLRVETAVTVQDAEVVWGDVTRDIAVLQVASLGPAWLKAAQIRFGQTGYVLGHSVDTHELRVSKGLISYTKIPGLQAQIAAHADNGYSGGPVVDHNGHVCGMIVRGAGAAVWTTYFVPSFGIAVLLSLHPFIPNMKE